MKNAPAMFLVSTPVTPTPESYCLYLSFFIESIERTDRHLVIIAEFRWERTFLFGFLHRLISNFQISVHTSISCCTSTKRESVEQAICHRKTKTRMCNFYLAFKQSQQRRARVLMVASSNIDSFRAAEERIKQSETGNLWVKSKQPAHKCINVWRWILRFRSNFKCEHFRVSAICLNREYRVSSFTNSETARSEIEC